MASRPALEVWLTTADELRDDLVLVGRRLGVVRGRALSDLRRHLEQLDTFLGGTAR